MIGEHDPRRERQRSRDGRPTDEHRDGTCSSPDHDVLRRGTLQPQRVDEDVEQQSSRRQRCGEEVGGRPEPQESRRCRGGSQTPVAGPGWTRDVGRGRLRVRPMTRSMSRSMTLLMVLAPPADSVPPIRVARIEPEPRPSRVGHDHGRHRGDQQEFDDPRLRELDVGLDQVDGCHRHRPRIGDPAPLPALMRRGPVPRLGARQPRVRSPGAARRAGS